MRATQPVSPATDGLSLMLSRIPVGGPFAAPAPTVGLAGWALPGVRAVRRLRGGRRAEDAPRTA